MHLHAGAILGHRPSEVLLCYETLDFKASDESDWQRASAATDVLHTRLPEDHGSGLYTDGPRPAWHRVTPLLYLLNEASFVQTFYFVFEAFLHFIELTL